jgi:hypothetical protein
MKLSSANYTKCPFLIDDAKMSCLIKVRKPAFVAGRPVGRQRVGLRVFKKSVYGHHTMCDYYGKLSGNELINCAIFCEKTRLFQCSSCIFYYGKYEYSVCLRHNRTVKTQEHCDDYVSSNIKLGNTKLIKGIEQLLKKYESLTKIRNEWLKARKIQIKEPEMTLEQMQEYIKAHPELVK